MGQAPQPIFAPSLGKLLDELPGPLLPVDFRPRRLVIAVRAARPRAVIQPIDAKLLIAGTLAEVTETGDLAGSAPAEDAGVIPDAALVIAAANRAAFGLGDGPAHRPHSALPSASFAA